ncbi:hypothetical protein CANCADRAFT_2517 [Tortispora caseinolytica NRRL Y-17796]|uniref:Uncharacterized protein n=1 Tax=Tortispora caseinolytica NRRL Y-17796 TaxID=767744 RepID=A0A1E4TG92_9ASCO|nr:hypothetical protein CANCADRAFT_2517 [Tortispora caseinolytica NRRL Y-17796]
MATSTYKRKSRIGSSALSSLLSRRNGGVTGTRKKSTQKHLNAVQRRKVVPANGIEDQAKARRKTLNNLQKLSASDDIISSIIESEEEFSEDESVARLSSLSHYDKHKDEEQWKGLTPGLAPVDYDTSESEAEDD